MLTALVRPFDDSEGRRSCGIGTFYRRGKVESVADRSAAAERILEGRFGHIAGIGVCRWELSERLRRALELMAGKLLAHGKQEQQRR